MLVSLLVPFQFSMFVSLSFPFVVLSLALNRKFAKTIHDYENRLMFKPSSGRKVESGVWDSGNILFTKSQTSKVDVVFTPLLVRTLKTTRVAR